MCIRLAASVYMEPIIIPVRAFMRIVIKEKPAGFHTKHLASRKFYQIRIVQTQLVLANTISGFYKNIQLPYAQSLH
ncbi:hypothetical protein J2X69_001213 [Algoriphagus sp. 4150]|nr:hypothetical protein [Algoriphagus sp. 4150]